MKVDMRQIRDFYAAKMIEGLEDNGLKTKIEKLFMDSNFDQPSFPSIGFVMLNELLSCHYFTKVNMKVLSDQFHKDPRRKRIENGGFLSILFDLEKLKKDIDNYLTEKEKHINYAVGATWIPDYNAECWTIIPSKEYAILINGFMIFCLNYYSYVLIKNEGHLYQDIGFPGEFEILQSRAIKCAEGFIDATKKLVSKYPPDFNFSIDESQLSSNAFQLTLLLIRFAIAHELGHVFDDSIQETQKFAISIPNANPKLKNPRTEHEFAADIFAFNLLQKKYGLGVLNFIDFFFRLAEIYSFIFGFNLEDQYHPLLKDRFARILANAMEHNLIDKDQAYNYAENYILWIEVVKKHMMINYKNNIMIFRRKDWSVDQ